MHNVLRESSYLYKPTRRQVRAIANLVKVLGIMDPLPPLTTRLEAHDLIGRLKAQLREKYEGE